MSRIGYGGAPAAPELVERIQDRVPEGAQDALDRVRAHRDRVGRDRRTPARTTSRTRARSAGPRRRSRSRSSTTTARPVPLGENGEIVAQGPTIMSRGYWNRPDATEAAILPDGWFRTGDIGYLDEDGYLYLVDRAKDMIIRAGENVYCVEIENVLVRASRRARRRGRRRAAPHARRRGEGRRAAARTARPRRPRTCARTAPSSSPTSRCRSTSSSATSRCPRNPAGKVLKSVLRGDGASSAFTPSAADDSAL